MKKFISVFLMVALVVSVLVGLSASAFNAPAPFDKELIKNSGPAGERGPGSSLVMNNAEGLGTTTLFSGTSITANGTKDNDNINFNIYGGGGNVEVTAAGTTIDQINISASRGEYYLIPSDRAYINTGITPNSETKLEIYFMLPNGFSAMSEIGAAHPDVAGCNGSGGSSPHFGGPLLLSNGDIQYLYGDWPTNSNILTAKVATPGDFRWTNSGQYYYSRLEATGGKANAYLTDGTKIYEDELVYDISNVSFNPLFLFGQNNGNVGSHPTNPIKVGIKEAKITQKIAGVDTVVAHFIAVNKGSTQFSSTPAPSDCMFDLITGNYFTNSNNLSGSFSAVKDNSGTNTTKITTGTLAGGGLRGVRVADNATTYTYVDGNNHKWVADYLEIDQEYDNGIGQVLLHRNIGSNGEKLATPQSVDVTQYFGSLLQIKTANLATSLSNDSGAWMDGIIGPIINYRIELGSDSDGVNNASGNFPITINVLDINMPVTATASEASNGAVWKKAGMNFYITKMNEGDQFKTSIKAKDILFSNYNLLKDAQLDGNEYIVTIDIEFIAGANVIYTITTAGKYLGQKDNQPINVTSGMTVTFTADFDTVLYKFGKWDLTGGYSNNSDINNPVLSFDVTGNISLSYTIELRKYPVQILGKTTNNIPFSLGDDIKDGYTNNDENEIWYNKDAFMQLSIDSLVYKQEYFFSDMSLYVFDHFECNGIPVTGNLTIDSSALQDNPRVDDAFTVYAVYQKKYIINLKYDENGVYSNNGESIDYNEYSLMSPSAKPFYKADLRISGYSVNEGDTAVILLNPNKRYSVLSVSGDDGKSQISADITELLVVKLDQSYDIAVLLAHRTIRVDYVLSINDNNNREIFGMPEYILGGTGEGGKANENHTLISYTSQAQTLMANLDMLKKFNYRSKALMIYNYVDRRYDLITDKFADGKLDAKNDNLFVYYVDDNGNSKICLFVIQQYLVDFSTLGFIQEATTFTNKDLGSYTILFIGGVYTPLENGKYMVDFGTEIKISKIVGQYGKFVHYTGLNEEENTAESFFVSGDRYVGINFESTKLAGWVMPTIFSGSGIVLLLALMTVLLVLRSMKLKKQKLEKEAEIQDMKRRFNISDEIYKLRAGEDLPQS